jgi:hypothetical protein
VTSKSKKKLNGTQRLFVDSARTRIENLDAVAHAPNALWEPRSAIGPDQLTIVLEFYIALR